MSTILIHVRSNDLKNGENTISKVRKCVKVRWKLDDTENTQIRFSQLIKI